MPLYKGIPNDPNFVALVNQLVDAITGQADAGTLSLFAAVNAPGALTAAATAGSELGVGTYRYVVTFLTGSVRGDGSLNIIGETQGGAAATMTTAAGNQRGNLTAIPVGPAGAIGRRIYRTAVGGAAGTEKLAITLTDNTTTSYQDTVTDGALGTAVPTSNTTGTVFTFSQRPIFQSGIVEGDNNQDVSLVHALRVAIDSRSTEYSYTGGDITTITEKDGATTVRTITVNYNGSGDVSTTVEVAGGKTITTTYNYNGDGTVGSVTKVVA